MERIDRNISPDEFYASRLEHLTGKVSREQAMLRRLAILRMGIFLATIILVFFATAWGFVAIGLISLAGIIAFLFTVWRYTGIQRVMKHDENLLMINSNEQKALNGDFTMFEDGVEFNDPDHPFASDLDIFGKQSIFQYFNRSATNLGQQQLAQWFLQSLSDTALIGKRQLAVAEIAYRPEFRQEFLATGYLEKELASDKDDLLEWVNEPASFSGWKFTLYLVLVPILTFSLIILIAFGVVNPVWLLLYHAVPFGVLGLYLKDINRKYRMLSKKSELVRKYSGLLSIIENTIFQSEHLQSLKKNLKGKVGLPSASTRKLSAILNAFETRNNMIMGYILNFLFLWDIIQVRRMEKWQALHRDELPKWLEVLAETDAICSLGNFHFNHRGSIFPRVSNDGSLLEAMSLGHPLVPGGSRVDNPASIPGWQHFTIITGANMAGKSTYLRTVGVSLVLAMAGSAVIAEEMAFCPVSLVTSIRTKDSLQKNESYFYAELKRLKYIIGRLQDGEKLVVLLDEILKGTNSRDKQSGSVALLEKLLRFSTSGLIATHDLSLGAMEQDHPGKIVNKSFEVVIENDLLVFDYKLKNGIARQMNATFLMKKMGITD